MAQLSPKNVWDLNEKEFTNLLNSGVLSQKQREIRFYAPSFTYYKTRYFCSSTSFFPTISVTGTACSQNCKHCGGKVLGTMHPALNPQQLFDLCVKLKADGAGGCLISGGCMPDGSVPLKPFADVIGRVKRELGLTVFVHTGMVDSETAVLLKSAGVDAVLIDVVGSDETIRKVFNLNIAVRDYAYSLKALQAAGLNVIPHVIVGLNNGELGGEFEALKMILPTEASAIVIIAFMPIHGTEMEKAKPPKPIDIAKVAATARVMFPNTPLVLGCMRPKGKLRSETDVYALQAGVDAVAFPSEKAVNYAQQQGHRVSFSSYCCAQIYMDFKARSQSK
jgi:lipoyl synthase